MGGRSLRPLSHFLRLVPALSAAPEVGEGTWWAGTTGEGTNWRQLETSPGTQDSLLPVLGSGRPHRPLPL